MAIKKSELYSSLWASCDELRGGMDASQYKDYVLVMLFIKYVSDKWAGQPFSPIAIPEGAGFADMVKLKGDPDIGDKINKKIIEPLAQANHLSEMPDFNDTAKLGSGKEMVDRLSNLIAIFENPALDFSNNKAEGDDILGDAYEYLMRHFATESGKSKGQFYTPAEVSRTMAKIIGINKNNVTRETTVYDPTCGSGSLLLRVAAEVDNNVSLYGQEKENATASLAQMNMYIHGNPTAPIVQGNSLAKPLFLDDTGNLKTFDYVVANPPFSDKRWSNGLNLPEDNPFNRFRDYGIPPAKNGDYAFLLHIIRSLKRHGKGAIILPHGVLFRGNAEAEIRRNLIKKGYIKGIIGLPANLFYGTGIPAVIIVLDKEDANTRKGIFMIDAGKGYMKHGNKNRLREQDIRKITDVFNGQIEIPGYSRMVSFAEIEKNDYNLNIPRYIDNQEKEDIQDIRAHLNGGIPTSDIDDLDNYWKVFPTLRKSLFESIDDNYVRLTIETSQIRDKIYSHPEYISFVEEMDNIFSVWKAESIQFLKALGKGSKPKEIILELSESILQQYENKPLVDKYDIYQHLMTYWNDSMQDDCYIISADGWIAETYRIHDKKGKERGWSCDLVPKELVINRYFKTEKDAIDNLEAEKERIAGELSELEEEHSGEDGYFSELDKVNKANIQKRLRELKGEPDVEDEVTILKQHLELLDKQSKINKKIKETEKALDEKLYNKYPELSEEDVKSLVVDDKWMESIETAINGEIDNISQRLTNRIKELAERYETPLPVIEREVEELEKKVKSHLQKMGFEY
ncbi:MAG: N-6 DNA methylase [Bacteroidales bacterium]|nr:N-6 DNA methylase [Bacteroidales bacterium]